MAVKVYAAADLVQRMVDLYTDKIRYHSSHWQVLGGPHVHRSDAALASDGWVAVDSDTIFITNMYQELMRDFLLMEQSRPDLATSLRAVTVAAFISAAQTQFTA